MITLIVGGIAFIALAALVVGVIDATRAPALRQLAAERREEWEARVLELHGGIEAAGNNAAWIDTAWIDTAENDDWDDD